MKNEINYYGHDSKDIRKVIPSHFNNPQNM